MSEQIPVANPQPRPRVREQNIDVALDQIRQSLQGLKFGQVIAIVQDGVVVQVERIEKKRIV
ncbi:DUF2292 domain-containing protein [Planctomicrobium sp. SH661]|uniref:DUF2292 domain-containing protein n=1 Tax=Planctomicrobium sp. SH661 TaxID=3448124 RepID=UPI003F5BA202